MRLAFALLLAAVLLACSSSSTGTDDGCTDIAGTYDLKVFRQDGDCPDTGSGRSSISISRGGSTGWSALLDGIDGACPGALNTNTCRFTAKCEIRDSVSGKELAAFDLDYRFAGATLVGTISGTAEPPVYPKACTVTSRHEGTRR